MIHMNAAASLEATLDILAKYTMVSSVFQVKSNCSILSALLRETHEWLCGRENATRASISIGISSEWATFQFWVNYHFKEEQ